MATSLPGRRPRSLLGLVLLLFCSGATTGWAGDPADFTFRAKVTEVRISFSATDQNNHGVATLQASDFAVVDKDVIIRNFQSFTRSDWTKFEIAILADASESVTPRFRQEMAELLELVSQTAGVPDAGVPDENLSIFTFHGVEPVLLCAGDCRTSHAAEQLPAAGARGLTPLYDSILFAANFLSRHGDANAGKVLIVFSDGSDTISRNSLDDAVETSLRTGVQLYCIDQNNPRDSSPGAAVLRALASATGGRYFPPNQTSPALQVILEGFRASYTVSYRMPSQALGFHTIRILPTHNLNLQFRSRSGYFYPY
ncbi:MAG: VWA domain-containing protein [Candidatus Sulfotelmatobacter sp.]|jgi:VWFA-related protein